MIIAAMLSFGILFVAWILAPGGPAIERVTRLEIEGTEVETLPVAA